MPLSPRPNPKIPEKSLSERVRKFYLVSLNELPLPGFKLGPSDFDAATLSTQPFIVQIHQNMPKA